MFGLPSSLLVPNDPPSNRDEQGEQVDPSPVTDAGAKKEKW